MKLHSKSCLLDSFAWVMRLPPHVVATRVGHFGEDAGFHTQELIEAVLGCGWAVTAIERFPVAKNPDTFEVNPIEFAGGCELRFSRHLRIRPGVLLGRTTITHRNHAVGWDNLSRMAYDPAIDRHITILDEDTNECDDKFFIPHTFLRMEHYE